MSTATETEAQLRYFAQLLTRVRELTEQARALAQQAKNTLEAVATQEPEVVDYVTELAAQSVVCDLKGASLSAFTALTGITSP